jgi:hypothetical protein
MHRAQVRRIGQPISFLLAGCAALVGCSGRTSQAPPASVNGAPDASAQPAAQSRKPPTEALFEDVTQRAGIRFKHALGASGRFYFVESTPPGCAFFDYDNDGALDIFLVQSGSPAPKGGAVRPSCALYRNKGDGTFTLKTPGSGLEKDFGYAQGVAMGDFDNDGFDDLFVTAYGGNHLLRNLRGTGKFADVTQQMGLAKRHSTGYATSAAFGDFDGDGRLDLYVCYYAQWTPATDKACRVLGELDYCSPLVYQPETHRLYRNLGQKFADVSESSGIAKSKGRGLAVAFLDFNQDGRQDIFVANDLTPNMLWRNEGAGRFTDVAVQMGCAYGEEGVAMAGMGIAVADYNRSGRDSLYVSNFSGRPNIIFKNQGKYFQESSAEANLIASHLSLLSFGCEFLDYDADGWPDIVVNNGHVEARRSRRDPGVSYEQRKQLLHNERDGTFRDISDSAALGALAVPRVGRGLAIGDFDNDGRVDVLATNQDEAPQLLRNTSRSKNHWISLRMVGTKSNRDGLHARVVLETPGASQKPQVATVRAGSSYLSSSDRRLYFGLGSASTVSRATVTWPSGARDVVQNLSADAFYTVTEGKGVTATKKPRP